MCTSRRAPKTTQPGLGPAPDRWRWQHCSALPAGAPAAASGVDSSGLGPAAELIHVDTSCAHHVVRGGSLLLHRQVRVDLPHLAALAASVGDHAASDLVAIDGPQISRVLDAPALAAPLADYVVRPHCAGSPSSGVATISRTPRRTSSTVTSRSSSWPEEGCLAARAQRHLLLHQPPGGGYGGVLGAQRGSTVLSVSLVQRVIGFSY